MAKIGQKPTKEGEKQMGKYDQGASEQAWFQALGAAVEVRAERSLAEKFFRGLWVALTYLALFVICAICLFALFGCASLQTPAKKVVVVQGPLVDLRDNRIQTAEQEIGYHATISGLIQVGQMGMDCASQDKLLKQVLREMMVQFGAPAPQKITVKALSGSSLCGYSQGVAGEAGTLELGARNLARAEALLYWSDITKPELARANRAFSLIRTARLPE